MAEIVNRLVSALSSQRVLSGLCATAILGIAWTVNDFLAWKAFGTGGTPPTWSGYIRMTKFRLNHLLTRPDLLDPSPLSPTGPSYLRSPLPARAGPRARIMPRTMPQRQVPEPIAPETRARLQGLVRQLAGEHPGLLESKPSHTEGRSTDGLYARAEVPTLNAEAREDRMLDREIAHAHPADNSLHVWLSGPDARKVIEAGWGQRFPLSFVRSGWTMVYAPRDEREMDVVERIVKAGVAWVTGVEI
ncbi:hypothetical protein MMYC01_203426 [Madurella mycetomatis]|uniref:Luciferase domain-containing protein n=1 Tax=Madurella mycetomatis TaxID=100816 RepID=A0A175WAM3_9PEZI|nr:hypothetical protein MMYC01_210096 [Madurella mycetomatis]KXX80004.1 hypothetical protein MMYC01_203426 [Madurella mycetomatis]